jgi:hypothetical protein
MGTPLDFAGDPSSVAAWLTRVLINGPPWALQGDAKSPYVQGVCAVKVILDRETGNLWPVVLVDGTPNLLKDASWTATKAIQRVLRTKANRLLKITDVPSLRDLLREIAPQEQGIWETALVQYIRTPQVYSNTGDPVRALKRGIAGIKGRWDQCARKEGLLTAGHVVGAELTARVGPSSGPVAFAVDFLNSGRIPMADVAVVELPPPVDCRFNTTGVAGLGDWIQIILENETRRTQVLALKEGGIYMPKREGTAGDVYFAFPPVTQDGDSGAVAVNENGEVIGHLIGGSGGDYDFIQDIDYQIRAIELPDFGV